MHGALAAVEAVVPDMVARRAGTILFTTGASSVYPHLGNSMLANFAIAGGALRVHPRQCDEVAMSPKKDTRKPARRAGATDKRSGGFTDEERSAMKERVQELKRAGPADGESAVLAQIARMTEPDRTMARRLHAIIMAGAPGLAPKTWYGMPAYARDDKVVCFFQSAQKFKSRYATLGFSDKANLDDGAMWPTSFALKALTAAEEARIVALVKQALS